MKVITTTRIEITPEEDAIIKNFEDMLYGWQLNIDNISADLGELPKAIDTCFNALDDLQAQINEAKEMEW